MAFRIPRLAAVLIVGASAVALAQSGPMPGSMTMQHHPMMATSQPGQAAFAPSRRSWRSSKRTLRPTGAR